MGYPVLVTGGTGGIGSAIVRRLSADGYQVTFTWRRDEAAAAALAAETGAEAHRLDLADRAAVATFAETLQAAEEPFYGFVHNAGATHDALAATLDVERAAAVMEVNLFAFMGLVKGVVRGMTAARQGRIVAIGALAATRAAAGNGAYAASKAALEAYVRTLMTEVARRGVTANVVAPGWVETAMAGEVPPQLARAIPAQRLGKAAEVANAVAFLLRGEASYVNGTTLTVDGGLGTMLAATK
ncbi:SDR family NAD(P)-dependent oxidoreductase [Zavarzinia compransoris]|uniref:Short-chain dehydrogenase n=1 Tax=Zavarzinia compransoris TaxID=1264899 RepID=A0A317DWK2_9PROT|nr:SDR family oxidoreductase [Zavarzinia compransoris]PWR18911.1 short-chain dehydrogenase [Zavarzinia compransoris]TDP48907.1 short-subunit dehydrogenase [Zavarzinia compransoris]